MTVPRHLHYYGTPLRTPLYKYAVRWYIQHVNNRREVDLVHTASVL